MAPTVLVRAELLMNSVLSHLLHSNRKNSLSIITNQYLSLCAISLRTYKRYVFRSLFKACPGYDGVNRTTICSGHGRCDDLRYGSGTCRCDRYYIGVACQYGDVETCSDHGFARYDGSCLCDPNAVNPHWAGAHCDRCNTVKLVLPTC
jgi:hypothetical protein